MTAPCPICARPASEASRPFCSRRCAEIDLGRWLTAHYVVPGSQDDAAPDGPLDRPEPVE